MQPVMEKFLRRKPVTAMTAESGTDDAEKGELDRSIGLFQLATFGIGATIGTGIFIVLTQAVPVAGPAVIWSFVIAGVVAGLTAICYAELASAVPVSGSSYSYAYATLGEGVAMVVAACLLLEYGVVVGRGRGRLVAVPQRAARQPVRLHDPRRAVERARAGRDAQPARRGPDGAVHAAADPRRERVGEGQRGHGADQGRRADDVRRHRRCRAGTPTTSPTSRRSALNGITWAAGIIFFSYIGLDAVSTAGEEVKNPRRTMPLAIIFALITVTDRLHGGRPRRRGRAADGGVRGPGGRARRDPGGGDRLQLAGHRARRRRRDLDLQRHPRERSTARPASCSRSAATACSRASSSSVNPRTLHAGAQHDRRRRRSSACWPRCCRSTSSPR